MYGIYKYEYNGEVIYIGKTKRSFFSRIDCHSYEARFSPYLNGVKIFVADVENEQAMNDLEAYLIAKYKPILNIQKKVCDEVDLNYEISWELWVDPRKEYNYTGGDRTKGYSFTLHEKNVNKLKKLARENGLSTSLVLDRILSELP